MCQAENWNSLCVVDLDRVTMTSRESTPFKKNAANVSGPRLTSFTGVGDGTESVRFSAADKELCFKVIFEQKPFLLNVLLQLFI